MNEVNNLKLVACSSFYISSLPLALNTLRKGLERSSVTLDLDAMMKNPYDH